MLATTRRPVIAECSSDLRVFNLLLLGLWRGSSAKLRCSRVYHAWGAGRHVAASCRHFSLRERTVGVGRCKLPMSCTRSVDVNKDLAQLAACVDGPMLAALLLQICQTNAEKLEQKEQGVICCCSFLLSRLLLLHLS